MRRSCAGWTAARRWSRCCRASPWPGRSTSPPASTSGDSDRRAEARRSRGSDPFDDGEECCGERGPLLRRELVREPLKRLEPCAEDAVDDPAAVVREGDEPGAPVLGALAARDPAPLDEPVDRPGGGWERQAEVGGDLLDGVLAAVLEQEHHLHLGERGIELRDHLEQLSRRLAVQVGPEGSEELGKSLR